MSEQQNDLNYKPKVILFLEWNEKALSLRSLVCCPFIFDLDKW